MKQQNDSPVINARRVALEILAEVYDKGAYANLALNKVLSKKAQLNILDRRFITELVYGTIKATITLDWIITKVAQRPLKKIPPMIVNILRLSTYQIMYLDKVPHSAACNEGVQLAKKYTHQGTVKFVNAVLRNIIRSIDKLSIPTKEENLLEHLSLTYQHPIWMIELFLQLFDLNDTIKLCEFNNSSPKLSLRTNTLKITRDKLIEVLSQEGVSAEKSQYSPDGIVITQLSMPLAELESFKRGYWQVQDQSSMLVAEILQPQAGSIVIDMCSAPGGKATHIAQKMNNEGKVLSFDIYDHKLALIDENALRLGISIINTQIQDASIHNSELDNVADYVLVDAPCSGLGVLNRRADARLRKKADEMADFAVLQQQILDNAKHYVKVGGRLVYSTCTILPAENQELIEEFLKNNADFKLEVIKLPFLTDSVQHLQLLPQVYGIDGFYIASLIRIK